MEQTNWPDSLSWFEENDREALANALANKVATLLKNAIEEKGEAFLVVSGGSTPKPLFKALSGVDLSWDKVAVSLADERFVNKTHTDSNERLVREHLLTNKAASAKFISLYQPVETAQEAAEISAQQLAGMRPDVLILGMGNDGHTASLFPGSALLVNALDEQSGALCLPITPLDAPHERITMTLSLLGKSDQTFLHIVGADKVATLKRACELKDALTMPIWAFLSKPIQVFWSE